MTFSLSVEREHSGRHGMHGLIRVDVDCFEQRSKRLRHEHGGRRVRACIVDPLKVVVGQVVHEVHGPL